ncbi:MAG: HAD-IIB family hydrolase [Paraglaciecola sp.]|uniref:HAD-IIB family hydrolase n=1 Tax=Paraglaciecola sp. TaxID=1920173 RepID=UPI0032984244
MLNNVLIFSDLDGTLLDHHTYSFAAALPMLQKLRQANIPVIANTSKTYAELTELRTQIGLDGPFIIENGAAVYIPIAFFKSQPIGTIERNGYWVKEFSKPRRYWLSLIGKLQTRFSGEFNYFFNMSNEEIVAATGLSVEQAKLAASRQYGEPILWLGNDASKIQFIQAINELGTKPLQGGRFLHLSGPCDKGQALTWLSKEFQKQESIEHCNTIALGDGQNDIAMLEAADIAVRILSPANAPPELTKQNNVYTSQAYGPIGWAECLEQIIFNHSQFNK